MRPAPRRRSGPCLREPRAIRLHLSARHDRALQMDAQESVMEMRRDEPAALVEAAVFSRHRPVAVGCVGLTGFNADEAEVSANPNYSWDVAIGNASARHQ